MRDVSRETENRLVAFAELVRRWNRRINLIAPSSLPHIWKRHIDDCLQIAALVQPGTGLWIDIGSGGGFPGIVLAVAFADLPTQFLLVESDQRKCSFLRTAIRELGLHRASVANMRIESLEPQNAAYLSVRALAPLPRLMPYLQRHLAPAGEAWVMKGENWRSEIDQARTAWDFDLTQFDSRSQTGAAILKITGVAHG